MKYLIVALLAVNICFGADADRQRFDVVLPQGWRDDGEVKTEESASYLFTSDRGGILMVTLVEKKLLPGLLLKCTSGWKKRVEDPETDIVLQDEKWKSNPPAIAVIGTIYGKRMKSVFYTEEKGNTAAIVMVASQVADVETEAEVQTLRKSLVLKDLPYP